MFPWVPHWRSCKPGRRRWGNIGRIYPRDARMPSGKWRIMSGRWKNVLHNPRDSYWTHHLATLRHFFRGGFSRSRLKKPSHLLHGNLRVATHPWKIRPYFLSEIGGIRGYVPKFPWHGSPVVYCWNLLMEAILHHLGCIEPCKSWDKLPTSTGSLDFWTINSITNQKNTSELMCI